MRKGRFLFQRILLPLPSEAVQAAGRGHRAAPPGLRILSLRGRREREVTSTPRAVGLSPRSLGCSSTRWPQCLCKDRHSRPESGGNPQSGQQGKHPRAMCRLRSAAVGPCLDLMKLWHFGGAEFLDFQGVARSESSKDTPASLCPRGQPVAHLFCSLVLPIPWMMFS